MPWMDWDAPLADDRRDALIDWIAGVVHKRGLGFPATLLLETHKPLAFLASQSIVLGSGFLGPFLGPQNVQQFAKLLESRDNIDLLIQRIEEQTHGTRHSSEPADGAADEPDNHRDDILGSDAAALHPQDTGSHRD